MIVLGVSCAARAVRENQRQTASTANAHREVIAVLMHLVQTKSYSGQWKLWNKNGHNPDSVDSSGLSDIASIYHPRIGLYDTSDPDFVEYECQLLKMSGVDVVSVYVQDAAGSTLKHLDQLLKKISQYGLHAFPRLQSQVSLTDAQIIYRKFVESPTQWYVDGHPVFSWFSFSNSLTPQQLSDFKKSVTPSLSIWRSFIGVTTDSKWKGALDIIYGWVGVSPRSVFSCQSLSENYLEQCSYSDEISGWETDLKNAAATLSSGKINDFAIGISPGFDDRPVNGWNLCGGSALCTHQIDRANGNTYIYKWETAISSAYRFASIATFDDWAEGSLIFPTVEFGNQYLKMTRMYSAQFKGQAPKSANFDIPEWIYRIKKNAKVTAKDLEVLAQASDAISGEDFDAAENLILPLANEYGLIKM
jgi:hypothetical protein